MLDWARSGRGLQSTCPTCSGRWLAQAAKHHSCNFVPGRNYTRIQKAICAGFFAHAARKDPQVSHGCTGPVRMCLCWIGRKRNVKHGTHFEVMLQRLITIVEYLCC